MTELLSLRLYFGRYKWVLVAGFLCVIFSVGLGLVQPWLIKYAIDGLRENLSKALIIKYALAIVGVTLVQGVFRFFMRRTIINVSRYIEYDLRNDLFAHLQRLSADFYQRFRTGDIISRATNDLQAVRMLLGPGIMHSISTILTLLAIIAILISIHPRLALYSLSPLPFLYVGIRILGIELHKRFGAVQEQLSVISNKIQENFNGIRIIKAYTMEETETDAFKKLNREFVKRNMSLIKVWGIIFPLATFSAGLGMVVVLLVGGREVILGNITLGEFVAFNGYLGMLIWPMVGLGWVIDLFQRGTASLKRINEIFHQKPKIELHEGEKCSLDKFSSEYLTPIKGEIEFKNISFIYTNNNHSKGFALKNITFKIKSGQILGIIGPTGSGKSTLVNLLPRIYDATEGIITIDGINIRDIPLIKLRRSIGMVPQEPFLFSDTIIENLNFGANNSSLDEIKRVSEICAISKEIDEFPNKYETLLGERGINLSGGQKQRIAIARALLINPPILILDDAFSHLDARTEAELLNNLKSELSGKTTIIISHRISAIKDADMILVLDKGKIVEQGTHLELLKKQGFYARIYEKQLLEEEIKTFE